MAAEVVFSVRCVLFQITVWSFLVLRLFQTCSKNSRSIDGLRAQLSPPTSPHVCNFS